jgi:hypothetical protein
MSRKICEKSLYQILAYRYEIQKHNQIINHVNNSIPTTCTMAKNKFQWIHEQLHTIEKIGLEKWLYTENVEGYDKYYNKSVKEFLLSKSNR